jgi:hypothetical protein
MKITLILIAALLPTLALSQATGRRTSQLVDRPLIAGDKAIVSTPEGDNVAARVGDDVVALQNEDARTDNPHAVTKAQLGLGSVDNTSDAEKPISDAAQLAISNNQAAINANQAAISLVDVSAELDDYLATVPGATDALADLADALAADPDLQNYLVSKVPTKNLANPALIQPGKYYSPASGAVVTSSSFRSIGFIPVTPGGVYTVSGVDDNASVVAAVTANEAGSFTSLGEVGAPAAPHTVTIPAGHFFLWVNLTNDGQNVTTFDGTVQIEEGDAATAYEAFELKLDHLELDVSLEDLLALDLEAVPTMGQVPTKNLANPALIQPGKYYSPGSGAVVTSSSFRSIGFIPVTPGGVYTVSGVDDDALVVAAVTADEAGSFTSLGEVGAPAAPHTVTIPAGHFFLWVNLTNDGQNVTTFDGTVQIEEGDAATAYEAFGLKYQISADDLPPQTASEAVPDETIATEISNEAWYRYVNGEPDPYLRDKWPLFEQKFLKKDSDLVVVSIGTSLTARTTEHHSEHPEASTRPPLMHSLNVASSIWDSISWDGQQYSRYDDAGGGSENVGVWSTDHAAAEWDDGSSRNGLTRYSSTASASFSREVPAGAFAWRLVYRTDSIACDQVRVTVDLGSGQMEVLDDGSGLWVEANGYAFSQREPAPIVSATQVPDPDTDVFASLSIQTKSNTTYQKRLHFRCRGSGYDSTGSAKSVTFSAETSGRLLYWGHEWSPREYMITYINAARGGHNTNAASSLGLPRFADNEVHGFKPDLIYSELPIHNDGAAGATVYAAGDRWERLTNNYVYRADYSLSLLTRSSFFNYTPEVGLWTPTIATNFGGMDAEGDFVFATQTDGTVQNALDRFDQAVAWVKATHPETVVVHAVRRWVEAGRAIYGDLTTATTASSKTGPSMTNDGSHPNDIGSQILSKAILAPVRFNR